MKRHTLLIIMALTFILSSCESDETEPEIPNQPVPQSEIPTFNVAATKQRVNLFEGSIVYLTTANYDGNIARLHAYYDSIRWVIPNIYTSLSICSNFTISWGQVFILPGNYQITATGYKDNEIVTQSSLDIEVGEPRDFLGIDWKNAKDTTLLSFFNTVENYALDLSYSSENYPLATLNRSIIKIKTDKEWIENSKAARIQLSDYITQLYGKSKFRFEGEDISQSPLLPEYNTRFKNPMKNKYLPIEIWETKTSRFALIGTTMHFLPEGNLNHYQVVAEPT